MLRPNQDPNDSPRREFNGSGQNMNYGPFRCVSGLYSFSNIITGHDSAKFLDISPLSTLTNHAIVTKSKPTFLQLVLNPPMSIAFNYLDKALSKIAPLGVKADSSAPIIALVSELQIIDEGKSVVVARTLQHSAVFNEIVRSQVADMSIGERHETITRRFDSILTDSQSMLKQIEENRNGIKERFQRFIMKVSRGSIHSRFSKIRDLYLAVSADIKVQLDRETMILESYLDYRGAIKEAEISAAEMTKVQWAKLDETRGKLATASDAIIPLSDPVEKARAQLARDEAERIYSAEDRRYQLCKEITEQLITQYNVGDTVMGSLNQTRMVKNALYDKGVIFFPTADTILTSLDANFTSTAGLNESRRAIDATSAGINRGLEILAEVGTAVKTEALKTAYGSTVKADSVKKLIESIISFRFDSIKVIEDMRIESAKNSEQIAQIVEDGKDKMVKLVTSTAVAISV